MLLNAYEQALQRLEINTNLVLKAYAITNIGEIYRQQAKIDDEIVQHIDYVIGMNREVKDDAAITFAISFYDGLGGGLSTEKVFTLSRNAVQFENFKPVASNRKFGTVDFHKDAVTTNICDHLVPVLKKKPGLAACEDPKDYRGLIWTYILPEPIHVNEQHLITIKWGNWRGQQIITLPQDRLLLCYKKRNQDPKLVSRIIIGSGLEPQNYSDAPTLVSYATKVRNGGTPELLNVRVRQRINSE